MDLVDFFVLGVSAEAETFPGAALAEGEKALLLLCLRPHNAWDESAQHPPGANVHGEGRARHPDDGRR